MLKLDDNKILYKKFLDGDSDAFNQLVLKHKDNIVYFIFKHVKNMDASEDIFQDVMLYILENKEKYDSAYSLKTYFYTIAKSRLLNYMKREGRIVNIDNEENLYIEEKLLEDIIFSKERKEKIVKVMKKMNEDYHMVIYLTIIEGLSYAEVAKIMEKSISQIKNLAHRARIQLRELLIKEKVIEIKGNKIIRLFLWFLMVGIVLTGVVYAGIKIYEGMKGKAKLHPSFTEKIGDTNMNHIWIGSFQIAWNDFLEKRINGEVEFEDGYSNLANELNKKSFTRDMLSEKDYYIKVEKTSQDLERRILNEVNGQFGIKRSNILDGVNFKGSSNGYTLYSMLLKKFEFIIPFDTLSDRVFGNSEKAVKYFGINNASSEDLNGNIEVLFYDSFDDFAVKLKTKENEEVILYKTNRGNSFEDIYGELKSKTNSYDGNAEFQKVDEIKIPYIDVDTIINYDELCGRTIKGKNGLYIEKAMQDVKFTLNEKGGNLISEVAIKDEYKLENENARYFYFTDNFIVFLKEKDKEKPYFALKVDNVDILQLNY